MFKKVSVIVPVYNGEKYLNRCIDSVLYQALITINELEIILVNDGSIDGSARILNDYKNKYPHLIKVVNQQNRGVAEARNIGIDRVKGIYTIFIDQDDYIDKDYIYTFLKYAEKGNYDIVVGGYKRPDIEGKITRVVKQSNGAYSKKYKISAAWAKMHRTEFLQKHDIKFYKSDFGEDIIFTLVENNKTKNIKSINYVGYNWFWNSISVSNTKQRVLDSNNVNSVIELMHNMNKYVNDKFSEYYILQSAIYYLLLMGRNSKPEDFLIFYNKLFNVYEIEPLFKLRFFELGPKSALLRIRLTVFIFVLLHHLKLVKLFASVYCRGKN